MDTMMDRFRQALHRLATVGRRDALRRDLDEEMRLHRELLARDIARGVASPNASAAAARAFGNTLSIRERSDAAWGLPWIEDLIGDIRYGARHLRRSPMFAAVAIVAIGVAIGINAGFFTLIDAFVWQPIPVARSERFVKVVLTYARGGSLSVSYAEYQAIASRARSLEDVVAFAAFPAGIRPSATARPFTGAVGIVSGTYFSALGAQMVAGRALTDADDQDGAPPAIVVSHAFWVAHCGSSLDIVGTEIVLGGSLVTVVGIASPAFVGAIPLVPDAWMTLRTASRAGLTPGRLDDPDNRFISLRAHLRPGLSIEQAQADLSAILAQPKTSSDPRAEFKRVSGAVVKPNQSMVPFDGKTAVLLSPALVVVVLVLVIACANLANLLLARALARQREMALRLAIGASRTRLVRQLLTESLMIAVLGAALGLVLSQVTVTVLSHSFFGNVPATFGAVKFSISGSWRVVAYTVLLAVVSVIVFGLAPALQATAPDLSAALKGDDALFGTTIRRSALRDGLVAVQVAGCVVLLVASGTLVKNLLDVSTGRTGLAVDDVMVASMGVSVTQHVSPAAALARTELARQVAAHPDVAVTARVLRVPFNPWWPLLRVSPTATEAPLTGIQYNRVTPRYFDVVGQRVVDGRFFTSGDSVGGARVAIVTVAAARRFWPTGPAIGKWLRVANAGLSSDQAYTVVGVVADAHSSSILDNDAGGYVYLSATASDFVTESMALLVRPRSRSAAVARDIDDIGRRIDPSTPMSVSSLTEQYDFQLTPIRYAAYVTAGIGACGLALAMLGLYGIVAFGVTQRRRDVAVHLAMGAGRGAVLSIVLKRELRLVLIGLGAGAVLAIGEGKLISAMLVEISPMGPIGLLAITLALLVVAFLAALVPATRALSISPMQVLRQE